MPNPSTNVPSSEHGGSRPRYTPRGTASMDVGVPQIGRQSLFSSRLYSRWLADFKLVECALALPIETRQAEWLRDYRDFLLVALGHGETVARTAWCQASIRRFLYRLRNSHEDDMADFIRNCPIRGVHLAEHGKVANVLRLFRSMPHARSLTEGLGFMIVPPSPP